MATPTLNDYRNAFLVKLFPKRLVLNHKIKNFYFKLKLIAKPLLLECFHKLPLKNLKARPDIQVWPIFIYSITQV